MEKPVCKYGASCYRKNPDHLRKFSHRGKDEGEKLEEHGGDDLEPTLLNPPSSKRAKVNVDPLIPTIPSASDSLLPIQACLSSDDDKEVALFSCVNTDESCIGDDPRDNVRKKFLVDFPEDFYLFWDFCKSLEPKNPSISLKPLLGLELVGAYDVLAGKLEELPWEKCVLHFRHYFDPPELSTVLIRCNEDASSRAEFHIGYFRDDPSSDQYLLVSNDSAKGCELAIEGSDIFLVVRDQIQKASHNKSLSKGDARMLKDLDSRLSHWRSKMKHPSHQNVNNLQKKRSKEIVADTFNKLGIVVPYDKKTEIGYRPLPLAKRELLKLLNKISDSSASKSELDQAFEPLQEIITFVQFANDECDYGMGMELGMNLFCHGDPCFHKVVEHLLPLAYDLLQRDSYAKICRLHLKQRNRTPLNYNN